MDIMGRIQEAARSYTLLHPASPVVAIVHAALWFGAMATGMAVAAEANTKLAITEEMSGSPGWSADYAAANKSQMAITWIYAILNCLLPVLAIFHAAGMKVGWDTWLGIRWEPVLTGLVFGLAFATLSTGAVAVSISIAINMFETAMISLFLSSAGLGMFVSFLPDFKMKGPRADGAAALP